MAVSKRTDGMAKGAVKNKGVKVVEINERKRANHRPKGKIKPASAKERKKEIAGVGCGDDLMVYGKKVPEGSIVTEMLRLRGEGLPLRMICARYGISHARLESWMSQGEEDLDEGRNSECARLYIGMARAETTVAEKCMKGILDAGMAEGGRNWQALAWIMERCFPEEYGMAKRADVGEKGSAVRVVLGGSDGERPRSEPMAIAGVVTAEVSEVNAEVDSVSADTDSEDEEEG